MGLRTTKNWICAGVAVLGLAAGPLRAAEPDNGGLEVVKARPNFYMIA